MVEGVPLKTDAEWTERMRHDKTAVPQTDHFNSVRQREALEVQSAGVARRGRTILLLADGMTITDIATTVGISRRFVYKWVQRFLEQGLAGLADHPGRGPRRGQ